MTAGCCFCICILLLFRPKTCSFWCGEYKHRGRSHLPGAVTEAALPPLPCPVQNQFVPTNWSLQQLPFSPCRSQPLLVHPGWPNKAAGGAKQTTPKKSSRELFFKLLVQIPTGSVADLKLDQVCSRQLRELQEKIAQFKSLKNKNSANQEDFCLLYRILHSILK